MLQVSECTLANLCYNIVFISKETTISSTQTGHKNKHSESLQFITYAAIQQSKISSAVCNSHREGITHRRRSFALISLSLPLIPLLLCLSEIESFSHTMTTRRPTDRQCVRGDYISLHKLHRKVGLLSSLSIRTNLRKASCCDRDATTTTRRGGGG